MYFVVVNSILKLTIRKTCENHRHASDVDCKQTFLCVLAQFSTNRDLTFCWLLVIMTR